MIKWTKMPPSLLTLPGVGSGYALYDMAVSPLGVPGWMAVIISMALIFLGLTCMVAGVFGTRDHSIPIPYPVRRPPRDSIGERLEDVRTAIRAAQDGADTIPEGDEHRTMLLERIPELKELEAAIQRERNSETYNAAIAHYRRVAQRELG